MSLTDDDLKAIKGIIDSSIDERVPAIVQKQIDDNVPAIVQKQISGRVPKIVKTIVSAELELAVDELRQHVAAGFAGVDDQFSKVYTELDEVHGKLNDIARVQQAEIGRTDAHTKVIKQMSRRLHMA